MRSDAHSRRAPQVCQVLEIERLESRVLLSAADSTQYAVPFLDAVSVGDVSASPQASAGPSGYTPAQVRHAYGFDNISFAGGTIPGDGSGTTIAIVDAYDNPNIASDLHQFNLAFGLPDSGFTKVDQTGGTNYPAANSLWATEIALDVQWAHAIAPKANILLVEAASNSYNDLFAAVDYARNAPGVVAVSMSWGGGEFSFESFYDSTFTTPAGHGGVTFVASSGDSGAPANYPASSPNVLTVGGTTLSLNAAGTWLGETGWGGSGGGISAFETQPAFQNGTVTQSSTQRTTPDVAYNSNPGTGFPVYDSYNNGTATPWGQWGGTSAAAPQWAALIAIANQGRILAGNAPLDGPTETLPKIYALPSTDFHDITSGTSTGSPNYSAGSGYDLVTGRGSPYADLVVGHLVGSSAASSVGSVNVTSQNGVLTYGTAGSATFTISVNRGAAADAFDANLALTTGLPAGSTYSFTVGGTVTNTLHFSDTDETLTATLTISTATKTPAGSYAFKVKAERVDASGDLTGDLATGTGTLSVGKRALAVNATGHDKVYDGTLTDTVSLSDNRLTGDVLTVNYTTATFANKNVGSEKPVTVSGISLTGTDAGNYTVNTTASTTAYITPRALVISATGQNKVYDGTTAATVVFSDNRITGDVLITGYTTTVFSNKTVGTGKAISVSGITLSGAAAGNYTCNTTASTTANITPRALIVSATGQDKVYDGTTADTVSLSDNRVSGDVLTVGYTAASFASKNVGAEKTVTVTGITLTGTDAGNYTFNTTAGTTAYIHPRAMTVSATGQNKIYNGTTAATVTLSDNRITGDVLTAGYTAAAFGDKNVGTGKTISVTGITLSGTDAGNYSFNTTASTTGNITAKTLVGSITAANKVYDGTTAATLTSRTLAGVVAGDSVSYVGGTATFDTKDVGTGKTVTATGLGLSGTDAANYTVNTSATTTANITAASLQVLTVTATGINKVYDGTTAATVTLSDNRASGDVLTVSYTSASFADKNVGTGKTVTVSGITISGTDAGNYSLDATTITTTASITPRALAIAVTGEDKIYDGTTTDTVHLSDNRISGDLLTVGYTAANFADKNVGTEKPVSVTGITLAGADAGNYTFNTTASTTAYINRRALVISATGQDKSYDGTTTATVTLSDNRIPGDLLTTGYTTATFADPSIGTGKTVSVSGITLSGTDAGNYTFNTTATTTASITAQASLPTSHVLPFSSPTATRLEMGVAITGTDPIPPGATTAPGLKSYDIYLSTDGGAFVLWKTIAASTTSDTTVTTFIAQSNHTYAFHSVAVDNAGNVESKGANVIEASISVPDLSPPVTKVTAVDTSSSLFVVSMQGYDVGDSGLAQFDLWVGVDGAAATRVASIPAPPPDANGISYATTTYQSLSDGASHTYRIYTIGRDKGIKVESSPTPFIVTVTPPSPQPTSLSVQSVNAVSPSLRNTAVSTIGFTFSEAINASTLDWNDLTLTRNGGANLLTSAQTVTLVSGNTYQIGNLAGLTGADGSYVLTVNAAGVQDLAGNAGVGSQSTSWTMDATDPAVTSLTTVSPNPTGTAVGSLAFTFSEAINASTLDWNDLTLTVNGGANLLTSAQTVTLVSGNTYQIGNLDGLTEADGSYVLTINAAGVQDLAGNAGTGSLSTSWVMSVSSSPTSHVLPFSSPTATRLEMGVAITGTDPIPPGATTAPGLKSYDIYLSTDGGAFVLWKTIAASTTSDTTVTTFIAQSNHTYAFHSVAVDNAGNVESKGANVIEASISVPDLSPPVTKVTAVDTSSSLFVVSMQGYDVGDSGLAQFDLWVGVDGAAAKRVAVIPAPPPDANGISYATTTYQALSDGASHTYRIYTIGRDKGIKVESSPTPFIVTASFAQRQVTSFSVQPGDAGRSLINSLDVVFSRPDDVAALVASINDSSPGNDGLSLRRYGLAGTSPVTVSLAGRVSANGTTLGIDVGTLGLTTGGDYQLGVDLDGNGSKDQFLNFYRPL
jgi:hypothetical protein